jgi:UDP-glucose 4-epimerase
VYGPPQFLPITEDHPRAATDPYGASKARGEELLDELAGAASFELVQLRVGAPFGPGQDADALVPNAMRAARTGGSISLVGGGAQRRDYVYVEDAARAFVRALEPGITGTLHVCSGELRAVRDVIRDIERVSGREVRCVHRAGDVIPELPFDVSRAREALGDFVQAPWDRAMAETWTWFANEPGLP